MRHVAQPPSHFEVELRQPGSGSGQAGAGWRAIRRVGPDGTMTPLTFGSLAAAQTHARKMNPGQARVVAVERDGWRRVVGEGEG